MLGAPRPPEPRLRLASVVLFSVIASGCAANLASLQRPEALAPGEFSVQGEAGVGVPIGTVARATAAGVELTAAGLKLADSGEPIADETLQRAVAAGVGLALNPPGTGYGASARVGVVRGLDVGARFSTSDWRLDAKWTIAGDGRETAANSLMMSYSHQRFSGLLFDVYGAAQTVSLFIPGLELEDPKRWETELLFLRGRRHSENLELSWGARGRLGGWQAPYWLDGTEWGVPEVVSTEDLRGQSLLFGGLVGGAVGKDWLWARGELTGAWSFQHAEIAGLPVNFGGPVLYPAVAVEVRTVKKPRGEPAP